MIRKSKVKVRRALRKALIFGSAALFCGPVGLACSEEPNSSGRAYSTTASLSPKAFARAQMAMNHNQTLLQDKPQSTNVAEALSAIRE